MASDAMISLRNVTKRFANAGGAAVDDLTLDVREGETVVLVGPSGCGKTTTMRMINRLIEPTSGTIEVDGRDVMRQDPVELRRGIGYVIQSIGLLPHRTVAQNMATVPKLVGWDEARVRERTEEILRAPATEFVKEFVGAERGLKRLALIRVSEIEIEEGPVVGPEATVEEAHRVMEKFGFGWTSVVKEGELLGWVDRSMVEGAH